MGLDARSIAETLSTTEYRVVSAKKITLLANPKGKNAVADATIKALVPVPDGLGFMIISGDGNRELVQRGVENILKARSLVGESCAAAILPPVLTGQIDGRTYALWQKHQPLPTGIGSKIVKRWMYAPRILDWAHELCADSLRPALDEKSQFQAPLELVSRDAAFPPAMRRYAENALNRIGDLRLMQCIQHGDFWEGNVLRSMRGDSELFVIDWAGANLTGYPVMDVTRMLMSLSCSKRARDYNYGRLCRTLSCDRCDLVVYALASIGYLGANLEHFPVDRYYKLGVRIFNYLTTE
nr:phosphotransferase [Halomonas sp.]